MTAGDLLNHFRMKLVSLGLPVPFEVLAYSYLDQAYKSFVAGIGGVSDEEVISVDSGATNVAIPSYVLKIKAVRDADGKFVELINRNDTHRGIEFGIQGDIRYFMIGTKVGVGFVAGSPLTATTITLDVDRLPKVSLTTSTSQLSDVVEHKQLELLNKAVALAMQNSQDSAVRSKAQEFEVYFAAAVQSESKDKDRLRSKAARVVSYGGI